MDLTDLKTEQCGTHNRLARRQLRAILGDVTPFYGSIPGEECDRYGKALRMLISRKR